MSTSQTIFYKEFSSSKNNQDFIIQSKWILLDIFITKIYSIETVTKNKTA